MATVYLNPSTGNDSYTYAQAQNPATPWLTPGKVQTSATSGDTAILAGGTYAWASITFTKILTLKAAINGAAIINAGGSTSSYWSIQSNISFVGCNFTNFVMSGVPLFYENGSGSCTSTFTNCNFYTITPYNGTNLGACSIFSSQGMTGGAVGTFSLVGCSIYNITSPTATYGSIFVGGAGCIYNLTGVTVYLNSTPTFAAIFASGPNSYTVNIKSSAIENAGTSFPFTATSGGTITVTTPVTSAFSGMTSMPSGITSDPLFTDPVNGNFNPQQGSPLIGAGTY